MQNRISRSLVREGDSGHSRRIEDFIAKTTT